jgi:hypothetical protein
MTESFSSDEIKQQRIKKVLESFNRKDIVISEELTEEQEQWVQRKLRGSFI